MKTLLNKTIFLLFALCISGCLDVLNVPEMGSFERTLNFNNPNLAKLAKKYHNQNDMTNLSVKFFGDSHVASGDLVNGFMEVFFDKFSQNAAGHAYAAIPKYHRNIFLDYKVDGFSILNSQHNEHSDYPLCGVLAVAERKNATITLAKKLDIKNEVLEILYKSKSHFNALEVSHAKKTTVYRGSENNWRSVRMEAKFPLKIKALEKDVIIGGYKIYNKGVDKIVDVCGINGASAGIWRKWSKDVFVRDFKSFGYDLVAIEYGTNDAFNDHLNEKKFYSDMQGLVANIKSTLPDSVIVLLSPPSINKPKFRAVKDNLRKLAQNENLLFYDVDLFMRMTGGKEGWIKQNLSKKDVHLTKAGYEKVGVDFANELKKLLDRYGG